MFINDKKILTVVKVENGGGGGGGITPSGTIEIKENGVHDVTNYASANVNVPSKEPTLITKEATENGTYNASEDGADGYSSFSVNVPTGYDIKQVDLDDGTCELIITDNEALYNLTIEVNGVGSIENTIGTTQHKAGSEITLKAIAGRYGFIGWYENGVLLTSDLTYTYTMPKNDVAITATFAGGNTGPDIVA